MNLSIKLNAKYPYLTAWVGQIALNVLVAFVLGFIPSELLQFLLQVVIGFLIFKFVVERNILPYVHNQAIKINPAESQ